MTPLPLRLQELTAPAFAPFGDVLQTDGQAAEEINRGHTDKFADLARIDVSDEKGRAAVHIFRSRPLTLPLLIGQMERHPLGSQAFMPLQASPFVVVVAPAGSVPAAEDVRGFVSNGRQGVNLHRGVWHHYQITLEEPAEYLVIDRAGPGVNFEEKRLNPPLVIERLPRFS